MREPGQIGPDAYWALMGGFLEALEDLPGLLSQGKMSMSTISESNQLSAIEICTTLLAAECALFSSRSLAVLVSYL